MQPHLHAHILRCFKWQSSVSVKWLTTRNVACSRLSLNLFPVALGVGKNNNRRGEIGDWICTWYLPLEGIQHHTSLPHELDHHSILGKTSPTLTDSRFFLLRLGVRFCASYLTAPLSWCRPTPTSLCCAVNVVLGPRPRRFRDAILPTIYLCIYRASTPSAAVSKIYDTDAWRTSDV